MVGVDILIMLFALTFFFVRAARADDEARTAPPAPPRVAATRR